MAAHVGQTLIVRNDLVTPVDIAGNNTESVYAAAPGNAAKKTTRYEKMMRAYGKINAGSVLLLDTLQFTLGAKEIISAELIINSTAVVDGDSTVETLKIYPGANLANTIVWATGLLEDAVVAASISYDISYIKGAGRSAIAGAAYQGAELRVQITT